MTEATQVCPNPECRVADTGVCEKGFPLLEACPDYSAEDVEELDPGIGDDEDTAAETTSDDDVTLISNQLLSEKMISSFRGRFRTNTVVLIGEQKTGKTTLLAALYGLLCRSPLGDRIFAGSRTLYSFAERNRLALKNSKLDVPTTPRTSRGDPVGFFHLRLRTDELMTDLLISDRSGEAFEAASVNTALLSNLTELALADRVCLLLDADRLTNIETRANYKRVFKQTIQALVDNAKIPRSAAVEILVTKIDQLSEKIEGRDLDAEIAAYEQDILVTFAQSGYTFEIYRICALPRLDPDLGFIGLSELIKRWTPPSTDVDMRPIPISDANRKIDMLTKIWS